MGGGWGRERASEQAGGGGRRGGREGWIVRGKETGRKGGMEGDIPYSGTFLWGKNSVKRTDFYMVIFKINVHG